jgi:O-methyltransferase involved in polyketide biosynthesis
MSAKDIAKSTAKVLQSYLTYQAVKTIIDQLQETNPPQAIWLAHYSDRQKMQDGEAYIQSLMTENKELVMRILTVREHLAEQIVEFLPEMVKSGISQANMEHRRHLLERLTQYQSDISGEHPDKTEMNTEIDCEEHQNLE